MSGPRFDALYDVTSYALRSCASTARRASAWRSPGREGAATWSRSLPRRRSAQYRNPPSRHAGRM